MADIAIHYNNLPALEVARGNLKHRAPYFPKPCNANCKVRFHMGHVPRL